MLRDPCRSKLMLDSGGAAGAAALQHLLKLAQTVHHSCRVRGQEQGWAEGGREGGRRALVRQRAPGTPSPSPLGVPENPAITSNWYTTSDTSVRMWLKAAGGMGQRQAHSAHVKMGECADAGAGRRAQHRGSPRARCILGDAQLAHCEAGALWLRSPRSHPNYPAQPSNTQGVASGTHPTRSD